MLKRYSAYAFSLLLLGGISLVGCQSTSSSKPAVQNLEQVTIIKSPNDDRQYSALLLPNGLQVVLVSDPTLENSAASIAVGVGSAHDPKTQLGLAHYLEHMLFLGTEKYPEPDGFMKYTQANGGMTNAFTAYDKTNYLFQINAGKFDEALDRFSDYFKKPTFDPHFSDKERNAVNNEWSLQKAQDGWNLFALQGFTANPESPAAKFNIGNLDTLKDKPGSTLQDEMKKFYNSYYSANIMKLTLVGKQSLPELKALAEKHFSSIPNKNVTLPEVTVPGLTKTEMGKSIHYKPIKELKALYVDFPVKSNKHQWRL
jgi:protease-3